jgi:glucose/arabinose dehydrogenase
MTCNNGGLVAVAFSPRYATTGRFYVAYDDSGCNLVIAHYRVSANPDRADPSSAQIVLSVPMAQPGVLGHAGCQLSFSPIDGSLYVSIADGSNGGDPQHLAQNPATLPVTRRVRLRRASPSPSTHRNQ